MPDNEVLVVAETAGSVRVTLNRPDARNAINAEMAARLHDVCHRLELAPKPLFIFGSETVFAAGADIRELHVRRSSDALLGINSTLFARILRLPMPTVAVIEGPAIGGGAELAYACDYRLGTQNARFSNPEPRLGIMAAAGATHRLVRLVGEPLAKDILLFGRELAAREAYAHGLLNQIVDKAEIQEQVERLEASIAQSSALALQLTKRAVDAPESAHPLIDNVAQAVLFEDDEKELRMSKFLERQAKK